MDDVRITSRLSQALQTPVKSSEQQKSALETKLRSGEKQPNVAQVSHNAAAAIPHIRVNLASSNGNQPASLKEAINDTALLNKKSSETSADDVGAMAERIRNQGNSIVLAHDTSNLDPQLVAELLADN